jgi:hypothetical protein
MLEPTPPTTSGIASGRNSSGQHHLAAACARRHRASERADGADPDRREQRRRERAGRRAARRRARKPAAHELGRREERERASAFPSQIALRSHGASTSPSSAPASRSGAHAAPRPSSAVKTIATQSSPYAASSPLRRKREVEDDERRDDEEQHRRERVPRAQLEQEILPGERGDVAE